MHIHSHAVIYYLFVHVHYVKWYTSAILAQFGKNLKTLHLSPPYIYIYIFKYNVRKYE